MTWSPTKWERYAYAVYIQSSNYKAQYRKILQTGHADYICKESFCLVKHEFWVFLNLICICLLCVSHFKMSHSNALNASLPKLADNSPKSF